MMRQIQPVKPREIDPLAVELLEAVGTYPSAKQIVLGGYFALKHYCDYRLTHDVDAWWDAQGSETERDAARLAIRSVLTEMCQRHEMEWAHRRSGDTEAWELRRSGKKVFSFQISMRTIQLEPYVPSPWPQMQIESLTDNLASKMNALVQRAAPRDFIDIYKVVSAGLATTSECWSLWQRKNPDIPLTVARAEVIRHLQELELRRPLNSIPEESERAQAATVRNWFRNEFLTPQSHVS